MADHIPATFTPDQLEAWQAAVAAAEAERPKTEDYFRRAEKAAMEPTFSGELRRAIHGIHSRQMLLPTLLERAQIDWATLEPFMTGDGSLPSEAIDRLADALGLHLQAAAAATSDEPAASA
ncbi:MAG TPA: hypothetical protein VM165_11870 [Planctomycetaceae bacterium]|nr:hypothetical protein [Planctomycetaceae bacterium]